MIWTDSLTKRLIELKLGAENYTEPEITDILNEEFGININRNQLHGKLCGINIDTYGKMSPAAILMPYYAAYDAIYSGTQATPPKIASVTDWIIYKDPTIRKILYLGDMHIPFEHQENVELACQRNLSADVVVLSEIMDCYSLSRFAKEISMPFEAEIDRTVRFLEYVSSVFVDKPVFILKTNHGDRVRKNIESKIPNSLVFLTKIDINEFLARPFPNVIPVDSWFMEINDAVFAHMERASKQTMKTGVNTYQFFREWKPQLPIVEPRIVVQGHNHMLGVTYESRNEGGRCKVIEGGCLCKTMDYAIRDGYSKPQCPGYVTVEQRDGISNISTSREWPLESDLYMGGADPMTGGT
jgi:hypothetical protein